MLQHYIDSYNSVVGSTRCGDSQCYISTALSRSAIPLVGDYFCPHGVVKMYHLRNKECISNTVRDMLTLTMQYSYVSVDVMIDVFDHAFVLYGDTIIDSYVDCRTASTRKFDVVAFESLLCDPSTEKWNNLFLCRESRTLDPDTISLEFSYDDPVENPHDQALLFVNNIRRL